MSRGLSYPIPARDATPILNRTKIMNKIAPAPPLKDKIALEMAEVEFDRFTSSMDLDVDTSFMDADDLTSFSKQKRRIITAIQNGSLIINDNGEPIYTPQKSPSSDPIVFHERTGASVIAMDGKKKNQQVAQTYAVMAEMTRSHPGVFAKLKGIDIKICEAIFALLMD